MWEVEFYEDDAGDKSVKRWWTEELDRHQRRALGHATRLILQVMGPDICKSKHWGTAVGDGVFEFKLRHSLHHMNRMIAESRGEDPNAVKRESNDADDIVLRLFCHAHGDKIILLLHGYDKGVDDSKTRQQREIKEAKSRLRKWQRRRQRDIEKKSRRRRG